MKQLKLKIALVLLLNLYAGTQFAQTIPNLDLVKLEKASDYKSADPFVLQTANYLLTTPFEKDNKDRIKAIQFIYKWMSGTPDYSFSMDEATLKPVKGNNELTAMYMTAMTKYSLENKDSAKNSRLVKLNGMTLLLNYCENKDNNLPPSKSLKKLSEAKAKGELEKYF